MKEIELKYTVAQIELAYIYLLPAAHTQVRQNNDKW